MATGSPNIGEWYRQPGGYLFEVVAFDEDEGTIEIQHFDGTLEELDFDAWNDAYFMVVEAPEDWTGSVDMDPADMVLGQEGTTSQDWLAAMEFVDHAD